MKLTEDKDKLEKSIISKEKAISEKSAIIRQKNGQLAEKMVFLQH